VLGGVRHPADIQEPKAFGTQSTELRTRVSCLRRGDGEFRWHDARCEPLRDRGNIIQCMASVRHYEGKKPKTCYAAAKPIWRSTRLSHTGAVAYTDGNSLCVEETYHIWGLIRRRSSEPRSSVPTDPPGRPRLAERRGSARGGEKRRFSIAYRILLPMERSNTSKQIGQPVSPQAETCRIFATRPT